MEFEKFGSSSSRTNSVPAGIRVLVVDDDPTCLMVIESMLRTSLYEVVASRQATDALKLLRDSEGGFDLVLTDVHMPGMDGFQLLYYIKRDFNIPVIMMSADGKPEVMARGIESGACYYFVKPLSFKEIQSIWQYAFPMRSDNYMLDIEQMRSGRDILSPEQALLHGNINNGRQQEDQGELPIESDDEEEEDRDGSMPERKARFIWTPDLQQKFVKAVEQLGGLAMAVPKKIQYLMMDAPGITRSNVASHLQKCRIFVKRKEEERRMEEMRKTEEDKLRRIPTNAPLNSRRSRGHRHPQVSNQQHLQKPLQQGIGGNTTGVNACIRTPLVDHQNTLAPLRYNQSFPKSNQGNPQQQWLGDSSFNNRQSISDYPTLGMQQYGSNAASSGHNSTVFIRENDTTQTVHQQNQATLRPLGAGSIAHGFSNINLQDESNASVGFNNSNYYNTGIQTTSPGGGFDGLNQIRPTGIESSNNNNLNYNLRDSRSISDFNGTSFRYATQGMDSFGGVSGANQSPNIFTNVFVQEEQPASLPPPSDLQHQRRDNLDGEHNWFTRPFIEDNRGI